MLVGVEMASENSPIVDISTLKVENADYDPSIATDLRNFSVDGVAIGMIF